MKNQDKNEFDSNILSYHADDELLKTNQFLELVLDNVPNMIFVKDATTLNFLKFNKAGEELLGYSSRELIGKSDYDFFPKDEADFFVTKDREVLSSGKTLDIPEEFVKTLNQGKRLLHTKKIPVYDEDKRPLYLIGISEDITDKKRLMEKRERLEVILMSAIRINELIEHSLEAVVAINDSGVITTWNSQSENMFGWTKQEAIGQHLSSLIIPVEFRDAHINGLKKFSETGDGPILNKRIELKCYRKDGTIFPIELTVTPIEEERGYSFYAFIRDITDLQLIKEKQVFLLEQEHLAREAAEKSLKMRDDFLSIAAHELKTPITPLALQLQVIEKILRGSQPQEMLQTRIDDLLQMIQNSKKELTRFTKLVDVLLDVTRISAGRLILNFKQVDLVEIVNSMLLRFGGLIKQSGSVVETSLPARLIGEWDKVRVESIIENLLTNAIKYGNGSPIKVTVEKSEDQAIISVVDNGIGISKDDQEKIFKRFERASSVTKYSGLGLGLYITKNIVEAHHGEIIFSSELNKGSTFVVKLPIHQEHM